MKSFAFAVLGFSICLLVAAVGAQGEAHRRLQEATGLVRQELYEVERTISDTHLLLPDTHYAIVRCVHGTVKKVLLSRRDFEETSVLLPWCGK